MGALSFQSLEAFQESERLLENQIKRVHASFWERPKTMLEVAKELGIERANICWFCKSFREGGNLYPVKMKVCSISKHWATALSTNPEYKPEDNQLKLF
jgi:hypothetical protein